MLLIGDIHITSKVQSEILDMIRSFVQSKPEEKNLIFLGDFVYHFSYDRGALLGLFELFLELYRSGKNLYILAGNHDWLGNTFVYEEGKRVFDLLQKGNEVESQIGNLFFITKPELREIEGEKVLFLPYVLDFDEREYPEYGQGKSLLTDALSQSQDKNEVLSGKVNQLVNGFLKAHPELTLIHHYYINKVQFPSYRSTFSFKDVALSEQLLDQAGLKMISGHLHAPFVYKNYLCAGSVWATSPLEANQIKGLRTYNQGQIGFFSAQVVNYFQVEQQKLVQEGDILALYEQCSQEFETKLKNQTFFHLLTYELQLLNLKKTILNLKVSSLDYENLDEMLSSELREKIADFRLKKSTQKVDDLLEKLQKPDENALQSFGGRKELLKSYLLTQYGEEYPRYEEVLRELKIL